MVLSLSPTRRARADAAPAAVAEQLRRHGWTAREVEYDAGVDPDVRLRVGPGAAVCTVELLLPAPSGATGHWQAVREQAVPEQAVPEQAVPEQALRDRAVWSGPAGTCPPEELVAFLESLLLRPERDLAARYVRLG